MKGLVSILLGTCGIIAIAQPSLGQSIVGQELTNVTPAGNQYDITGGVPAGTNLFHSFGKFDLNTGQTANFQVVGIINNVFARVTGGNPSVLNGTLQLNGGINPNLYFINPAGIVFGQNFQLNIPAALTATTANGIAFGNQWMNSVGPNNYALFPGDPTGFGFTMAQPAGIINTGNIQVNTGETIQLLGGTVISNGSLSAPAGTITTAAVPGNRIVRLQVPGNLLGFEIQTPSGSVPADLPFVPTDLPALITAGNAVSATGITDNGDGTLSLTGASRPIAAGDVVLQNVGDLSNTCTDCARQVLGQAAGSIQTKGIQVQDTVGSPGQIALVAGNDISTANLRAILGAGQEGGVFLQSTGGNIQVDTIEAGLRGIEIDAAGLFRAVGILPNVGYTTALKNYPLVDSSLVPFLVGKTGSTEAAVTAAIANSDNFADQVTVNVPVSIRSFVGPIKIRYGNSNAAPINVAGGVTLQGGDARFESGPTTTAAVGDRFSPVNPGDDFSNFVANPFGLQNNDTFTPIALPENISGSAGAIIRGISIDGSLTISLQDQVFGSLPPPPVQPSPPMGDPPPMTPVPGQTAVSATQRTTEGDNACSTPSTQLAQAGPSRGGTRTASASGRGCTAATTDDQAILKILE